MPASRLLALGARADGGWWERLESEYGQVRTQHVSIANRARLVLDRNNTPMWRERGGCGRVGDDVSNRSFDRHEWARAWGKLPC